MENIYREALAMKIGKTIFIVFGLSVVFTTNCVASSEASWNEPWSSILNERKVPKITGRAWVLMEANSGWIVASKNIDERLPPASITKLMTNYVIFAALQNGQISLEDKVSISEKAWRAEGSRMFAEVGSKVGLKDLLMSSIIQSGNDAAIALAEHVAGDEESFALRMNASGRNIGLQDSMFINSTGLPADKHRMSTRDIALLSRALMQNFPDFYPWYAEKQYEHNNIVQYNRNKLLWKEIGVDGLKTGHTQEAGFCLVASARRKDERWIAVVMGTESESARERAVTTLLDFAYQHFKAVRKLDQMGGIGKIRVMHGDVEEVRVQPASTVDIVVPRGEEDAIEVEIRSVGEIQAPVNIGDTVGMVELRLRGELIAQRALLSMSSVERSPWWKRIWGKLFASDSKDKPSIAETAA